MELEAKLDKLRLELEAKLAETKFDLFKWIIPMLAAQLLASAGL